MAKLSTLAGRLWHDPFIEIPPGYTQEIVDQLIKEIEEWSHGGHTRTAEFTTNSRGGGSIRVRYELKEENKVPYERPLGRTSRRFYIITPIENYIRREAERAGIDISQKAY